MKFKVPIQNIYALLCYCHELPELIGALVGDSDEIPNESVLEKIFLKSLNELLDYGLVKSYKETKMETPNVKGKILFNESLNPIINRKLHLICETDDFTKNILPNQIIKSTLLELSHSSIRSNQIRKEAFYLLKKFGSVSSINIKRKDFYNMKLNRSSLYKRVINIAQLLYESQLITDEIGSLYIYEVVNNERKMEKIFEKFLLNFYKYEQSTFKAKSEILKWPDHENSNYLPDMRTDVSLISKDKKIIIEAKYYTNILVSYYGKERFNSQHLYQVFSYLNHSDKKIVSKGILLYPLNNVNIQENFEVSIQVGSQIERTSISVMTIDLSKNWHEIHQNLLDIINDPA